MADMICTGKVADPTAVLQALDWSSDAAFMLLERVVDHWLTEEEQKDGFRFDRYDEKISYADWPIGRVFDKDKELRWQKADSGFDVVYCGADDQNPPELVRLTDEFQPGKAVDYLLWGRWSNDHGVFYEAKMPRLFKYPVENLTDQGRVQIGVIEYRDQQTGQLHHYRFTKMEAAQ